MILKPDKTTNLGGVTVNEYLLTNHNPNHIDMPSVSMEGKIIGVTIHNTSWITTAAGTTPAEQYTRATVNGNMNDVRVHYYVDNVCVWQNLPLTLSGWHAADGSGNGNRRTIAIECIMSSAYNSTDKKSEDNCAIMAVREIRDYMENGNIVHSVNFPDCDMGVCTAESRVVIFHKNIANMITQFTAAFGEAGINISDMTNKSRGEYAYTMMDINAVADDKIIDRLKSIDGVFRVRVVK